MQLLTNDDTLLKSPTTYFRHKGIKINFEDIEDAIEAYQNMERAAVVCDEDEEGNRRLSAYIVCSGVFDQAKLTQFLTAKLKPFMVPAIWVRVKALPLTAWGTIDKNALQKLQADEVSTVEFTAPRSGNELKLARIIKDIMQLKNISVHDHFLRLGGSSLQALKIIAAIRKELKVRVDVKYFFVYPTIAQLAGYLDIIGTNAYASNQAPNTQSFPSQSILHHTSIVPIKAEGKKLPLYIVCGGGGSVFTFEKFAYMLDKDQPVYGFQQPSDINEFNGFPKTIEGIAAKYVNELLAVNPDGPYALSGHCIGGVIALEMARILQSMNKKIHLLAMFDVILDNEKAAQKSAVNMLSKLIGLIKKVVNRIRTKIEFETFLITRHTKHALDYKFEQFRSGFNKVNPFRKVNEDYTVFKKFEQKFLKAYDNYKLKSFAGNILVFYANDRYLFLDPDKNIVFKKHKLPDEVKNRWKEYAGDVQMFDVDGEHSRMFEPRYSKKLAVLLQQHLEMQAH